MATINELTELSVPTGSENVVVQNDNGNYRMEYKPNGTWTGDLSASTAAEAITAAINAIRTKYGDIEKYHVMVYGSIPNWPNGIVVSMDRLKAGNYIINFGTMYSQQAGVVGFCRWDTINGAEGTLRVSALGNNLGT